MHLTQVNLWPLMFPLGVTGVTNIGAAHEQLKTENPSSVFELLALSCRYLLFNRWPVQDALGAFGC